MTHVRSPRAGFGPFQLDEAQARLVRVREGDAVEMAPRAFQILCALVRRAGRLVTKDALLDEVWGHRHINESALKNIVSQLRRALGDDPKQPRFIATASRRGYRFIAAVTGRTARAQTPPSDPRVLVGYQASLARLQTAFAAASRGERKCLFVLGDAGAGKSALVESFLATVHARTAWAQCIEHHVGGEAYMPVLDALNALCRADRDGVVVETIRRVAPSWLARMPWFMDEKDRERPSPPNCGMLREFGELADCLSADHALLVVLEDLHWCDKGTVQLLDYLARRRGLGRLMILGTFRPAELVLEDHPLRGVRHELRVHGHADEVQLEPMSEVDIDEFARARLGVQVPASFTRALHEHTCGLPLHVAAVVDELVASVHAGPTKS